MVSALNLVVPLTGTVCNALELVVVRSWLV